jgi:hypothetical protein
VVDALQRLEFTFDLEAHGRLGGVPVPSEEEVSLRGLLNKPRTDALD